jgi:hypothetical protein
VVGTWGFISDQKDHRHCVSWLIGWVVSDLDFTKYKALMAELLWILLADGGGY